MRRRPIIAGPLGLHRTALSAAIVFLVGSAALTASAQVPYPGLANGFEVDGNLYSNNPGGLVGLGSDWLDGPPGPGVGVFLNSGVPKDPLATWHFIDLIKSADQDVFGTSTKVTDNPNGFEWKAGSAPQKDDIQNGFVHLTRDATGNHWMVLGGDRRAITGSSYIDFEFLQNPLVMESDGSFSSEGPDSGRTVGDLLLTIELTKGGTQAQFFAQRWAPDGAGDFTYADIPFPSGSAFVAANIDSQVTSTFPVFDLGYYGVNQFGEAAVNLNALLPNFGDCFAIATVFVRTKSSTSASAELKDFIRPFQLNQCLDETPPDITCPADVTISCDQSTSPASLGFAFGTDNCGVDPEITYADSIVPGPCGNSYTILRQWKATDQCGNSTECVQTISLVDDAGPAITAKPGPITVQCPGNIPAPDISTIRATDDCGNVSVRHVSDVSDGQTCPEHITRTYAVDDGCGHTVEVVQIITVDDDTPPSIAAPQGISVECTDDIPPADIRLVTASDNCGSVTVTHVGDVSNGRTCPEIITRTYRATDACGNAATATQTITVDDNTPPEVSGPANLTVECSGEIPPANTKLIVARDNCSAVTVSFVSDVASRSACPTQITRTYRAVDECGNAAEYVQVITVDDQTPPVVSGPGGLEVECRSEIPAADTKLITATDNCGNVSVTHVGDVSDGKKCGETILRTYRATDLCGHSTDWVQIIQVIDRTNPRIACPGDVTVQCAADIPPANAGSISASDNCGNVTVTHVGDYSDGRSCPETISRVFRATDACGLTTECTQKIVVRDQTPPEITGGPGPVKVQCREEISAPATGLVKARDNCGSVTVVHIGDASDGKTCPETVTRTYRAYDQCNNYRDFLQVFTVDDDIPPVITSCSAEETVECPTVIFFPPPTATDNCDADPQLSIVFEDSVLGSEPWTF
ncbi:MAG: hypothetical protein H6Q78_707, partial [Candidatus Krumholzibacteriota bacterium]|nr:hypothetical protein [Candidatus Krumholzibacteriota bacterium]